MHGNGAMVVVVVGRYSWLMSNIIYGIPKKVLRIRMWSKLIIKLEMPKTQSQKAKKRKKERDEVKERERDRFDLMECDTKSEITAKNVTS